MAKVIVPRRFEPFTGSSWIWASFQAAATSGFPWMPNWAMKFGSTRKNVTSSKKPAFTRL